MTGFESSCLLLLAAESLGHAEASCAFRFSWKEENTDKRNSTDKLAVLPHLFHENPLSLCALMQYKTILSNRAAHIQYSRACGSSSLLFWGRLTSAFWVDFLGDCTCYDLQVSATSVNPPSWLGTTKLGCSMLRKDSAKAYKATSSSQAGR